MSYETFIVIINDPRCLAVLGTVIFVSMAAPSFMRWVKTVRCPKCRKWFRLAYLGFDVRDKVTAHSSTRFGGGAGGGIFRGIFGFLFANASRNNADPFIREWGTAHFRCEQCDCRIEIDSRRDRK
jgi:hypothetical protein